MRGGQRQPRGPLDQFHRRARTGIDLDHVHAATAVEDEIDPDQPDQAEGVREQPAQPQELIENLGGQRLRGDVDASAEGEGGAWHQRRPSSCRLTPIRRPQPAATRYAADQGRPKTRRCQMRSLVGAGRSSPPHQAAMA